MAKKDIRGGVDFTVPYRKGGILPLVERRAPVTKFTYDNNFNMKTKYSKPPKHALGAIIGAAGTAMSIYNSIKANKQAKEAAQLATNQRNSMLQTEDQFLLDKYPVNGNQMTGFYKNGGKIIPREIKNGTKEEMEHTSSRKVARRIAKDHLEEDSKYYTKLKKAGLAEEYMKGGKIYAYGGKTKPINWKTPDKFVNDLMGRNKSGFEFGGGKFGGAGAGRGGNPRYEDIEWIDMRTPIELGSFNDAFSKARKSGLKEFDFNGKKYNTNTSPNYDKNAGKSKVNARLRMVFDENNIIQDDSTRIEPELGQPIILPINKGKKYHSWAKGGNINLVGYNAKGGDLLPMSSNMNKVKGNTHEEDDIDNTNGVKLMNATGKAVAEVEDQEVIKDDKKVYSDRLELKKGVTYAKEAERVAKKIADAEKVLADPNVNFRKKNAAKIQRDNWNRAGEDLFNHQEMMKKKMGIKDDDTTKKAPGGFLPGSDKLAPMIGTKPTSSFNFSSVMPYVDNVANAVLTATTPKPAFSMLARQRKLKTDFNINPQLQDVTDTVNQTTQGIERGTSSSNVARANTTAVKLAGMKAKGQLYSQKENVETQLQNQDTLNQQQIEGQNLARIEGFNDSMQQRAYNIQGRTAANVANAVEDFNKGEQATAYGKYQDEQLRTIRETYNTGGTGLRVDLNSEAQIQYLRANPTFKDNAAKDYLQKNTDGTYKYPREAQRFLENFPEYK